MSDRLPPHYIPAELAIIGCCILDPKTCIQEVQLVFTTKEFFYDARCQAAWEILCDMEPDKIDALTFTAAAQSVGMASLTHEFVAECQEQVPSTANLSEWMEVVVERFVLRRIIAACTMGIKSAYENSRGMEVLEEIEKTILEIRPERQEQKDLRTLMHEAQAIMEHKALNWGSITGLSTGLTDLDALTDGLHEQEFIVVGAYPSCGKTALAVNMAVHNALAGASAGILSAEMRPVQLIIRSLCSDARVNFKKISQEDCPRLTVSIGKLSRAPIHIEKASGRTIGQITAMARRLKQKHDIKILVVDYIQLISAPGDNREQQIAAVGRGLKNIAGELCIPVIGLSQLNDDGKLRESRAIGQDADSVWILSNDGVWQPKIQPVILKVEKSRDGETGKVPLTFLKEFTRFEQQQKIADEDVPIRSQTND